MRAPAEGQGAQEQAPDSGGPATPAPASAEQASSVAGERAAFSLRGGASLQTRLTNLLAVALMGSMALGLLAWYYREAYVHPGEVRQAASRAVSAHAAGSAPLPPLGPLDPPRLASTASAPAAPTATLATLLGPAPALPGVTSALPGLADRHSAQADRGASGPVQNALDRRLAGPVFAGASGAATAGADESDSEPQGVSPAHAPMPVRDEGSAGGEGSLGALLTASVTAPVAARVLPTQDLLLPKGAFIDCTLETAIDSSLPGLTTCVTATDTFGADGRVVLLERGTKLVGETRGIVQQGTSRVFVLWTEARTPTGVVVPLDSPGTDELGRSGLPGAVNRHFFQRFGAAMLISIIDGAVQGEIAAQSSRGAVIVSPTGTQDVTTEALRSTVNIAPTVVKKNGDRIEVLVARDIDFRSVYELRPIGPR